MIIIGKIDNTINIYTGPKSNASGLEFFNKEITIGIVRLSGDVMIRLGKKKLFQDATNEKINCIAKAGLMSGNTIWWKILSSLAPSTLDASTSS